MKQYHVTGMSCAACSARVEKAVSAVKGVTSCAVSLLTNSMGVEGTASPEAVIEAVTRAGYGASLKDAEPSSKTPEADDLADRESPVLIRRLVASLVFLLCLMYLSMGHMIGLPALPFLKENPLATAIAEMLLAAVVMVINQKFFVNGVKGLLHRAPNMDTLVAMGSAAAFGYSVAVLFAMTVSSEPMKLLHGLYFESAAMIVTLITVGKLLEAKAKGRTTSALKSLLALSPRTAVLLREGKEITVPAAEVKVGDIFLVYPGAAIPVDGEVIEGESAVNEAALTGESLPVDKSVGSSVSAATVNASGFLKCRALRVGEDTALQQIIKTVREAAATKAPIARIADKVSGIFVPVVMGIALVTAAVWLLLGREAGFAIARGISVLVISCPCALGLATPVAIMVGSGVGAKNGILFKSAPALEEMGRVTAVVLDKTGTVTEGEPRVTDLLPAEEISPEGLLTLAASLEKKSEHPLAKAILAEAEARGLALAEAEAFAARPGRGLSAEVKGSAVTGGNRSFIETVCPLPNSVKKQAEALSEEGKTPLFFAVDGTFLGIIAVADVIKADSAEAITALKRLGITVTMLTGDNERTARAIGRQVGIDDVIAGVLPAEKAAVIRQKKAKGKVAMVGDGINDAPALTEADVGVAIGAGTDVAVDAADVVLMQSRLADVAAAARLSRATLRNIRENLFWAFFYNTLGIPLAAGVFVSLLGWEMSPMIGAAAMSLSSFCVVTNALRLNFVKPRSAKHDGKYKAKPHKKKEKKTMTKILNVEGMMCPHCEAHVKKALEALDGVSEAVASHKEGTVTLTLVSDVSDELLKQTVEAEGYTVK